MFCLHPRGNPDSPSTSRLDDGTQQRMARRELRPIIHGGIKMFEFIVPELLQDLVHQWYGGMDGGTVEVFFGGRI